MTKNITKNGRTMTVELRDVRNAATDSEDISTRIQAKQVRDQATRSGKPWEITAHDSRGKRQFVKTFAKESDAVALYESIG